MIRLIVILSLFGFLTVPHPAHAEAPLSEQAANRSFENMSYQELISLDQTGFSKDQRKAYKTALKAAQKAEKDRIKAEKAAERARINAEKARLKNEAAARKAFLAQEKARVKYILKSFRDTRIRKDPYETDKFAFGRRMGYRLDLVHSVTYYLRARVGPDFEQYGMVIEVEYDVERKSDGRISTQIYRGDYRDYYRLAFFGGQTADISNDGPEILGCTEDRCEVKETIFVSFPREVLTDAALGNTGIDTQLRSRQGHKHPVTLDRDYILGFVRKCHYAFKLFGDIVPQVKELHEPWPDDWDW